MSQKDLTISEMQQLQKDLQEANKEKWGKQTPEHAKSHLLYMVEEMGECISIIKKKGINSIMENKEVRARLVEEMTDVQNHYIEVLNCLQITPEEYSNAYMEKHNYKMNRNYAKENKEKYKQKTY